MVLRTRKICIGAIAIVALVLFALVAGDGRADEKPVNVVFILADDLGWTDMGCYGSTFQTITLEKGLRQQAGPNEPFLLAEPVTCLSPDYFTLGQAFKQAGYVTGHFGKWHLGRPPFSPLEHGFDVDIPHTNAPGPLLHGFFHPFPIWPKHGEPGDHLEDLLADEAVKFLHKNRDRPFFLNYWAFQVHSPWQAKQLRIRRR